MSEPSTSDAILDLAGFFGREKELALLSDSVRESLAAGSPASWMLTGPPGIGKTALAEALSRRVAGDGVRCHWGACHDREEAPPYWPWGELLQHVAGTLPAPARERILTECAPDLLGLLEARGGRAPDEAPTESGEARFRFFAAIASFLYRAAEIAPRLLIIDDLHWADGASLELTAYISRQLRARGLALIATCRELELQQARSAEQILGDLSRTSRHLPLSGLAEDAVQMMIEARTGSAVSLEFSRAVCDRTDGNPFFVDEMTRLMLQQGNLGQLDVLRARMPTQVRTAIRQHLRNLPTQQHGLLGVAAICGRVFEVTLLARVTGQAQEEVGRQLEDRTAVSVVERIDETGTRFRFRHALLQDSLVDDLEPGVRADIHRRIVSALLTRPEPYDEEQVARLARHAMAADSLPAEACRFATLAGRNARARYAYGRAAEYFARAIEAHDLAGGDTPSRLELLLLRGEALLDLGDLESSAELFELAFGMARDLSDSSALARAALGFAGGGENGLTARPDRAALLEEALERLDPDTQVELRIRVLCQLAGAIYFSGQLARPMSLARAALALIDEDTDHRTAAIALDLAHWICWQPENADERLSMCTRFLALAETNDARSLSIAAHIARLETLVELGEIEDAEAVLEHAAQISEEIDHQRKGHRAILHARCLLNAFRGEYEVAEDHARAAMEVGRLIDPAVTLEWYSVQLFLIREAQGRQNEILDTLRDFAAARPQPAVRAGHARMLAREGMLEEARGIYMRLLADGGVSSLRKDVNWPFIMVCLAEVAAAVGDRVAAEQIHAALRPFAGREVILGLKLGWAGNASLFLARLAATLGRHDDADRHHAEAAKAAERMDSPPARMESELLRLELMLERGGPGAAEQASEAMPSLERMAEALGASRRLSGLRTRLSRLLPEGAKQEAAVPAPSAEGAALRPGGQDRTQPQQARIELRGEFWVIQHGNAQTQLRSVKGLHQLATLIREPGREFHALDLLQSGFAPDHEASSDGGWLDARARAEYAARMETLEASLAEAEALGDGLRADLCRNELEALAQELSRHVGLGGRDRPGTTSAEKARVNVTRTIRQAIAKIDAEIPELARHLKATVRTGMYSSYEPERDGAMIRFVP